MGKLAVRAVAVRFATAVLLLVGVTAGAMTTAALSQPTISPPEGPPPTVRAPNAQSPNAQSPQVQSPNGQSPNAQSKPVAPNSVRITARNPLAGNWVCKPLSCTCKPLACAAPSTVSYTTGRSPARRPDPKALENFAKVEVPKRIQAANAAQGILSDGKNKVEMLSVNVASHLGYPSVVAETKFVKDQSTTFITQAMIFAGPALLTVRSVSPDQAVAMKSLNEFISAMTIQEGPAASPNAPSPTPPSSPPAASPSRRPLQSI